MPENSGAADSRSTKRITDPKALRALAHPIRLALIGLLRTQGPLTATRAAELIGESSASCSFHLRQLAKYGLAEEAPGGQGRERPWQATAQYTDVPELDDTAEFAAAAGLFRQVVAERYFDAVMRWLDARPNEPEEWQLAAQFGDRYLYLTPHELAELGENISVLLDAYSERNVNPRARPKGSRMVSFLRLAFPTIGSLAGAPPAGPGGRDDAR